MASVPLFEVGQSVELHKLTTDKYNGLTGVIHSELDKDGRYAVRLSDSKIIGIKPGNLKISLSSSTPRVVYVLGENHAENSITCSKINRILRERFIDYKLFGELPTPSTLKTSRCVKDVIPIPTEPSYIEGILLMMGFFYNFKLDIPSPEGHVSNSIAVVRLINAFTNLNDITEEQFQHNPSGFFKLVKADLLKKCRAIGGRNAEIIEDYIKDITYDNLPSNIVESQAFAASLRMVDDAIVTNVLSEDSTTPPEVVFIVITGELHAQNIHELLTRSGHSFVVHSYLHEYDISHRSSTHSKHGFLQKRRKSKRLRKKRKLTKRFVR